MGFKRFAVSQGFTYLVRGIFDSPRKSEMLYFNWAYVREGLPESRKGEVGTFAILCDNAEVVPRVE